MDCIKNNKQGAEILTDYCAGAVDTAVAAEIDAHIKQCEECRTMVEAQCAVWEMLDAWTPVEVSRDFDSRLYARITGEHARPAWSRWGSRLFQPATPYAWWKPAVSLAAAGAIVSLALFVRVPEQRQAVQPNSALVQTGAGARTGASPTAASTQTAASQTAASTQTGAGTEEIDLQQVQQALDDLDIVAPLNAAASPL